MTYLIRYNWAYYNGLAKEIDTYEGIAYKDQVPITFEEIEEQTLVICKEYNISYEYAVSQI